MYELVHIKVHIQGKCLSPLLLSLGMWHPNAPCPCSLLTLLEGGGMIRVRAIWWVSPRRKNGTCSCLNVSLTFLDLQGTCVYLPAPRHVGKVAGLAWPSVWGSGKEACDCSTPVPPSAWHIILILSCIVNKPIWPDCLRQILHQHYQEPRWCFIFISLVLCVNSGLGCRK